MVQLIIDFLNQSKSLIMAKIWSNKIAKILDIGTPLPNTEQNNWALTKQQALQAIDQLNSLKVPIFGGDVLELRNGVFQPTYDNWYCDPLPQETEISFLNRSITVAKDYIISYTLADAEKIFFVLVPKNN